MMLKIAPSLLASDFSRLGDEIGKVEKAGADIIHIDVMDGHFVPTITIGPQVVKSLRMVTGLPFDVHLMVERPENYIDSFIDAGADLISVHAESTHHLNGVIQRIKKRGKKAAVAVNPATSLSTLDWILNDVDMVLIMTVNPGMGGQAFMELMVDKVRALKKTLDERKLKVDIEVDGGIDLNNIYRITEAGANVIVAGTTVFNAVNTNEIVNELRDRAFKSL